MKAAIVICARATSSRLPKKHFQKIYKQFDGLDILCSRLGKFIQKKHRICIATTDAIEDKIFESKASPTISIFHGPTRNIPKRQLLAARKLDCELIVSIDGDDIFSAPEYVDSLIEILEQNDNRNQILTYTRGLPLGMNVSAYTVRGLEEALLRDASEILETGWGRIFENKIVKEYEVDSFSEGRYTLDYPEDLQFMTEVCNQLGDSVFTASSKEVIQVARKNNLMRFNEKISEIYWENFKREKQKEIEFNLKGSK